MELTFGQGLNLEQSQKLTLTPEMIQSLNILQFSSNDLIDFVLGQMEVNPAIDMENGDIYLKELGESIHDDRMKSEESEDIYDNVEPDDWDDYDWYDFTESMNSHGYDSRDRNAGDFQEDYYAYDSFGIESISLEEVLMQQLDVCPGPYIVKAIAAFIIQTLDERGYMTMTSQEIMDELNVEEEDLKKALKLIHSFEPAGVGAESLSECLALQAAAVDRLDTNMELILENHLEDIAANRIREVGRALGLKPARVQEYADLIRSFDPKPGSMYQQMESTRFIVPDVLVEIDEGKLSVKLNENAVPRVSIRSEYGQMLRESEKNTNVNVFLTTHINSAKWLAKAIEQRCNTIMKVSSAIVSEQSDFFADGRGEVKPLTMKDIAEKIGVHESTVSRAVNGKYIQSKQGIFELRYFVPGAGRFAGKKGSEATADSLKKLIRQMVAGEDRRTPLSDRSIAEAIMITGVEISRRTVAKYREEMGIPSSSMRRRVK